MSIEEGITTGTSIFLKLLFEADFADDMAVLNYQPDVLQYESQHLDRERTTSWNEEAQELTLPSNIGGLNHGLSLSVECPEGVRFNGMESQYRATSGTAALY